MNFYDVKRDSRGRFVSPKDKTSTWAVAMYGTFLVMAFMVLVVEVVNLTNAFFSTREVTTRFVPVRIVLTDEEHSLSWVGFFDVHTRNRPSVSLSSYVEVE